MYYVHGYLGNYMALRQTLEHLPHKGDTVRLDANKYATVTEVIWCMDEKHSQGQRVNLRMELEMEVK